MKHTRFVGAAAAIAAAALVLTGCSGSGGSGDDNVLRLWHYEGADSAMGIAWDAGHQDLRGGDRRDGRVRGEELRADPLDREPGAQLRRRARHPRVQQGQRDRGPARQPGPARRHLDDAVDEYGWDDKLAPSLQTTAKYDERRHHGLGQLVRRPELRRVRRASTTTRTRSPQHGLEVPTTYRRVRGRARTPSSTQGITPLAEAGAEYPLGQLWYQLALTQGRPLSSSTTTSSTRTPSTGRAPRSPTRPRRCRSTSTRATSRPTSTRHQGRGRGRRASSAATTPIFVSGCWWYGRFVNEATASTGARSSSPAPSSSPGLRRATSGSSPRTRRTRSSPTSSSTSRCAPRSRPSSATTAACPSRPTRPTSPTRRAQELIANFNALLEQDGLAFYPDWPTPTFYDQLIAGLQELVNGTQVARRDAAAARRAVPRAASTTSPADPARCRGPECAHAPAASASDRKDHHVHRPRHPGRHHRERRAPSAAPPTSLHPAARAAPRLLALPRARPRAASRSSSSSRWSGTST